MQRMLNRSSSSAAPEVSFPEEARLSARELEIFTLIGQGVSTQTIAEQLSLSLSTIDTYRERIKNKLRLANSLELTRRAILWVMHNT